MISDTLRQKLESLPDRPGVYLYRAGGGALLYVGKARSLRSRVRSYFQAGAQHAPRIERLVAEVIDLEIIVTNTELEALILESNWIKKERPRFNVVLRDDKQFPYLKLSMKDVYPRVSLVRRAKRDGNEYYGPFLPAWVARRTMKMIPRYFQVATCGEVFDGTRRPCLYYHLDQCLAPCAGKTNPEEYGKAVEDAKLFLEGRHKDVVASLTRRMKDASAAEDYERAAHYRDTLRTIERLAVRQNVSSVGLEEQDYLAHHQEGAQATLQLFQMREGKVQSRREFAFEELDPDPQAFYGSVLVQYYADVVPPPEIHVPVEPQDRALLEEWLTSRRGGRVRVIVPVRGVKRKFLDMVAKNAVLAFEARFRAPHRHGVEALQALADAIGLEEAPNRIECFDISNLHGTDSVASLVVFDGGKPIKSEYRIFGIRGVEGSDDFASIAEAVTRRYRRRIAEDRPLPDVVLIDGGAGQLGAAVQALAAVGLPMLPVLSIAKQEEEIHLQGGGEPIRLDRASPALQLVQRIRDEAHRFAVSRHRGKRSRRTIRTSLTSVRGIGPLTARKLLRAFGSVEGVRAATKDQLAEVAGQRAAAAIERWRIEPVETPAH